MVKMDGVGFRFEPESKVRLRNTVDPSIYGDFACVGNEGWVKERREDHFGLPEVLIQWDHNHWAYNGVPDCWTFEEHFELVEESMDKQEAARQAAIEFAERMAGLLSDEDEKPSKPKKKHKGPTVDLTQRMTDAGNALTNKDDEEEDTAPSEAFDEAIAAASGLLAESEAFIIVGVDARDRPYAFGYACNPRSELAVEAHLAGVTARSHQEVVIKALHALAEE